MRTRDPPCFHTMSGAESQINFPIFLVSFHATQCGFTSQIKLRETKESVINYFHYL